MATKKLAPKAKVKAPAKTKKDEHIVKTVMVPKKVINWKRVKTGTYFTANIDGKQVSGLIYRGTGMAVFLCQNEKSGAAADNKLGYKYSRRIWRDIYDLNGIESGVKDLDFPTPPKGFIPPVILPEIAGYDPVIEKGYVQFECKKVKNDVIRLLVKHLKD